ncbi:TPA: hypothetical protein ACM4DQ_005230, partial [Escherichia coli O26]
PLLPVHLNMLIDFVLADTGKGKITKAD